MFQPWLLVLSFRLPAIDYGLSAVGYGLSSAGYTLWVGKKFPVLKEILVSEPTGCRIPPTA